MPTTSVITLKGMAANNIDSDQYVDGSIDAVHLSANSVDSDSYVDGSIDAVHLSANSVDSDSYVDASIDLAHMSSESVDEDNLHISNAGSNGQFLSKQSGDAGGLTWAAAGGGGFELLGTTNASNAASIDFEATATGFTVADYTQFLIILTGIYPNSSTQLIQLQTDANDGASYHTSGYSYMIHSVDIDGLEETVNLDGSAGHLLTAAVISTTGVGNYAVQGTIWINTYGAAGGGATRSLKSHSNMSWCDSASDQKVGTGMGYGAGENGPYNAFRIMAASGNITGRATLYGAKIA